MTSARSEELTSMQQNYLTFFKYWRTHFYGRHFLLMTVATGQVQFTASKKPSLTPNV